MPGKIGAAMASAGLSSGRPPPPSSGSHHGGGGGASNPGNQLYIGNVSISMSTARLVLNAYAAAVPSWMAGFERLVQERR